MAKTRLVERETAPDRQRIIGDWPSVVAVSVLIGAALTLMMANRQQIGFASFLVLTMISFCFAAAYIVIHRLLANRLWLASSGWLVRTSVGVLTVVSATLIGGELAYRVLLLFGAEPQSQVRFRIMAIGFALLASIRLVNLGYERLRRRVREVELREERARQKALEAELSALQARTDPHFLFNALNTVAGVIEEDPQRAVQVVTRLGGFFRHSLQSSRDGEVRIDEEIEAVSAYLEIQSLRFGDRLTWSVESDPGLSPVRILPLLLQPLVENAVVHGMSTRRPSIRVEIKISRAGDRLLLNVEDDGPGPGESEHRGAGTSLADMAERLELRYSGDATMETGSSSLGGFRVSLDLPLAVNGLGQEP